MHPIRKFAFGLILFAGMLSCATPQGVVGGHPMRIVDGGIIQGTALSDGTYAFLGIPYAQPPTGPLRWQPPQPVTPWPGVRDAEHSGPPCLQRSYGWNAADAANSSEDCLYMDVRTPSLEPGTRLPVMVWIHGGANRAGAGFGYIQSTLPRHGVVLVTMQYRLGIFGFLSLAALTAESPRHASGNYALMDQIAVLQWVHDNIAKFGGDPGNVTLFGQSAGAQDVGILTLSPLAKGLFQKTIQESGTAGFGVATRSLAENEALGAQLEQFAGTGSGADGLAALRALPGPALLDAADKLVAPVIEDNSFIWLTAKVDGLVLPETPAQILARHGQNPVAAVVGTNARELDLYGGPANATHWVVTHFGDHAAQALRFYGLDKAAKPSDPVLGDAAIQIATDTTFRCPGNLTADFYHAAGQSVWRYQFDLGAPGDAAHVTHASELRYVFDAPLPGVAPWPPVQAYWLNFAKTGNPNGPGLSHWPGWDADGRYLEFAPDGPRAGAGYRAEICPWLKNP